MYKMIISLGKIKKPNKDEAMYTKKAFFIEALIIAIGIIAEAIVNMLKVLIGNNVFRANITKVKAINKALRVKFLVFNLITTY